MLLHIFASTVHCTPFNVHIFLYSTISEFCLLFCCTCKLIVSFLITVQDTSCKKVICQIMYLPCNRNIDFFWCLCFYIYVIAYFYVHFFVCIFLFLFFIFIITSYYKLQYYIKYYYTYCYILVICFIYTCMHIIVNIISIVISLSILYGSKSCIFDRVCRWGFIQALSVIPSVYVIYCMIRYCLNKNPV